MKRFLMIYVTIVMLCCLSGCTSYEEANGNQQVWKAYDAYNGAQDGGQEQDDYLITDDQDTKEDDEEDSTDPLKADSIDLTDMSSTMIYSTVYNMMLSPKDYIGKEVTMYGEFAVYTDQEEKASEYYSCIIKDATACCAQGLEFVLKGEHTYPDDYPEVGEQIVVKGTFDVYDEKGYDYCRLIDAQLIEE